MVLRLKSLPFTFFQKEILIDSDDEFDEMVLFSEARFIWQTLKEALIIYQDITNLEFLKKNMYKHLLSSGVRV